MTKRRVSDSSAGSGGARAGKRACIDHFSSFLVRHPFIGLLTVVASLTALLAIIVAGNFFAFADQGQNDFNIRDDWRVQQANAVALGKEDLGEVEGDAEKTFPPQTVGSSRFDTMLLYRSKSGNMLTTANLKWIHDFEQELLDDKLYPRLCKREEEATECARLTSVLSVVNYYWPTNRTIPLPPPLPPLHVLVPDGNGTLVSDVGARTDELAADETYSSVTTDRNFNGSNTESEYLRSLFFMGTPFTALSGVRQFKNADDRFEAQRDMYDEFAQRIVDRVLAVRDDEDSDVTVSVYSARVQQKTFAEVTNRDLSFAVFSVTFVAVYIGVHTRSVFVAFLGILQILLSFPFAFGFYRFAMGIAYFQSLHSLAVFIILGIGADNIFVFSDAWNQAVIMADGAVDDMEARMMYTYRRASKAMFVTSFTTMAAFIATGISDIMPIATFGYFAACLVLFNYVLDLTMLPCTVTIWQKYVRPLEHKLAVCLRLSKNKRPSFPDSSAAAAAAAASTSAAADDSGAADTAAADDGTAAAAAAGDGADGDDGDIEVADGGAKLAPASAEARLADEEGAVELHSVDRDQWDSDSDDDVAAIHVGSSTVAGGMRRRRRHSAASTGHAAAEDVSKLRFMERVFYSHWPRFLSKFGTGIIVIFFVIIILAGVGASELKPLSQAEEWFPDWHFLGSSINWLSNAYKQSDNDRAVTIEMVWGVSGVDRAGTDRYDPDDLGVVVWDDTFDASSPAAQQSLFDVCDAAAATPMVGGKEPSCFIRDFRDWLATAEGGMEEFPYMASNDSDAQRTAFVDKLTTFSETPVGQPYTSSREIGIDSDGVLRMVAMKFPTKLPFGSSAAVNTIDYDKWEAFMTRYNSTAPVGVNNAMQIAGRSWMWMRTEGAFVSNAVQGIILSISVAFAVLLLSTMNFVVGLLATISIAGIVTSVIATMTALGWQLGVTESISCVILIGFSVDYVVHIANSYIECPDGSRYHRTRTALTEMGISVVAGAVTTLGSGSFLWGGIIIFFQKFAILITTTISYSLAWSLLFFSAALIKLGPEGHTGSIRLFWDSITGKRILQLEARVADLETALGKTGAGMRPAAAGRGTSAGGSRPISALSLTKSIEMVEIESKPTA